MSTWQELAQSIIENHEKVNYDENPSIRTRVLKSLNRSINHVWSKADWTFKVQYLSQFQYEPTSDTNTLPENLLSFQGTGRVTLLNSDNTTPRRELSYVPFNRMMELLKTQQSVYGTPEVYAYGGPLNGDGNQRSIFLFPVPSSSVMLSLVYQATAPSATLDDWTKEISGIPANWHETVIEEVAILFRLMDKSADITAQSAIVVTALAAMMRDEPHGREDTPRVTPAYGWRMNVRYAG